MATYKGRSFHDDSDADDEYERSVIASPTVPVDFESSPTDSESLSTEHTPTTFSHSGPDNASPRGLITDWSAEQCADFVSGLGLPQYADSFVEEAITGDAMVTLLHADLKEMGITSIGHRLTILKGVYDVKIKQNVNVEPEHYVPLSAEPETAESGPTQDDIARIIHIIKDRDAELRMLKDDLIRISEENRKLREDILPLVKAAKDRSQPLPTPDDTNASISEGKGGLSRKFSTKRLFLSNAPKNPSPTAMQEGRTITDNTSLDPSAAALAASSHLTASMRDSDARSPSQAAPSPTSPGYNTTAPNSGGPTSRPFPRSDTGDGVRDTWNTAYTSPPDRSRQPDPPLSGGSTSSNPSSSNTIVPPQSATPSLASTSTATSSRDREHNPQVEIFKSFRVSIDDPCHKVLPVALKKYNITADWRQYALYIVHGDQERCLGLNERPLILFKQLDKEGRKPMFMLRKHATPAEGHTVGVNGSASGGGYGVGSGGRGEVALPGGVL